MTRKVLFLSAAVVLAAFALASQAQATSWVPTHWEQVWPESQEPDPDFVPIIDHYGGITVWSQQVGAAPRPPARGVPEYALYARIDGKVQRVPVATRRSPFDVDLGPGGAGGVVAAYSRCRIEALERGLEGVPRAVLFGSLPYPLWTAGRGCDLYRYDFATGQEAKLRGASTDQASEMLPSIWKDEVAFARVYEQRSGKRGIYPYLYVRPLTDAASATSKRQPGGSRGTDGLPGPTRLDLYGRRLSFVWNSVLPKDPRGHRPRWKSMLRLDTIDGGHEVLSSATSGSRSQPGLASFVGPQGSDGRIYYGFQRARIHEGEDRSLTSLLMRYRLSTGDKALTPAPAFLIDTSTDGGLTFLGNKPQNFEWGAGVPGKILFSSQVGYRE